jgi:hypothetical protein
MRFVAFKEAYIRNIGMLIILQVMILLISYLSKIEIESLLVLTRRSNDIN